MCFPALSAMVAGMPEAVAGHACARWVVHLWGRMISGGVGGTPAGPAGYLPARLSW
ncbi:MAG: hypothetical protein MSQ05_01325 [Akkermansia sp.]|nr:hypothetical protein [Akkermansia sp.]